MLHSSAYVTVPPGFEPGPKAPQALILSRLDYGTSKVKRKRYFYKSTPSKGALGGYSDELAFVSLTLSADA